MIKDFLNKFACKNGLYLIVDTSYGLNVDRDEPADRGDVKDTDAVFLNVIESGSMSISESGRKLNIIHNYEIGLFKRCIKETDGISYYDDIQFLLNIIKDLMIDIHNEFDVQNASYDTAIDSLDSNNVVVKLNLSIEEDVNIC